jgi:sec-independent protein translocase protein TatA
MRHRGALKRRGFHSVQKCLVETGLARLRDTDELWSRTVSYQGIASAMPQVIRNHGPFRGRASDFILRGEIMFEGLFQPMHLLIIFGIALLVFGPRKLSELGKGIGDGIRGFKNAMREKDKDDSPDKSMNGPNA